jgi:hypothetical protein
VEEVRQALVRRRRNPLWAASIILLLWTVVTLWYHTGAPETKWETPKRRQKHKAQGRWRVSFSSSTPSPPLKLVEEWSQAFNLLCNLTGVADELKRFHCSTFVKNISHEKDLSYLHKYTMQSYGLHTSLTNGNTHT